MQDYYTVNRLSNSFLGNLRATRLGLPKFKAKKETLDFGSQLHESILEHAKYKSKINLSEYAINKHVIAAMTASALLNPMLSFMLNDSKVKIEYDLFFQDDRYELPCKAKIDIWVRKTIGDIKTTDARSKKEFEERIKQYKYNRQAAFYLDATGADKFIIFGISKIAPYNCYTFEYHKDDELVNEGRKEYEDLIDYFIENRENYNSFLNLN